MLYSEVYPVKPQCTKDCVYWVLKCAMYLFLGYLDLRDPVRPVMRRRWLIK